MPNELRGRLVSHAEKGPRQICRWASRKTFWRIKLDKSTLRPVTHALLPENCGGLATACLDIQEDSAEAKRCDFKVGAEIGIKNV